MTIKHGYVYKLTEVFDEVVVGQNILTNGDEEKAVARFFEATVIAKNDLSLSLKRKDGIPGGGNGGAWMIFYAPGHEAKIVFMRPKPKKLTCTQQPMYVCTECRLMSSCSSYFTIKNAILDEFQRRAAY